MHDSIPHPDHVTSIIRASIVGMIVLLMFGPMLVMALYSRHLTPDIVYRWTAEGWSVAYVVVGGVLSYGIATVPRLTRGDRTDSFGDAIALYLGAMLFLFVMGTSFAAIDIEGGHNPYVRAESAYPRQYDELASVRRFPRVADQIRLAAADGVVTRGEAYDILNGDVLRDARFEQGRRETERARAEVLSTR